MKTVLITILAILLNSITLLANDTININNNQFQIDVSKKLVITNIELTCINTTWTNLKTHVLLNETCKFTTPITNVEIGTAYEIYIPSYDSYFTMYFTEIPIICISTDFEIIDDSNVLANFKMIENNQNYTESYIGIQYRGASSQSWCKKPFEIEFWKDNTGVETQDFTLLGMTNDDDWNLQAMYNEPLRIRSKTNNDLWRMVNTLHYQESEPEAINGVRMKYVELFINNEYRGLYCLSEKVNNKQLKLKKYKDSIRGELYKGVSWGASTFNSIFSYDNSSLLWGGFEYKYPDDYIDWSNIYNLVDFVINSSDDDFYQEYTERLDVDNLVDYFIFLNLLRATDNTGKNLYIAKYNTDSKYFYVPHDLDGSFGTIYDGSDVNITNDIFSNGLYNRLLKDFNENGFMAKLKNKWLELRSSIITHDYLMSMFSNENSFLEKNAAYDRESIAWTDYKYNKLNLDYMSNWIADRIAYLDIKFTEDDKTKTSNKNAIKSDLVKIYPNPTNDLIFINSKTINESQISIYNNLGELVLQSVSNLSGNPISLSHLKKGIYFIHISNKDHFENHKIILTE